MTILWLQEELLANPYIFKQINDFIETGLYEPITPVKKLEIFTEYLELAKHHNIPFAQIKLHAQAFTKGLTGGGKFRGELSGLKTIEELEKKIKEYLVVLQANSS